MHLRNKGFMISSIIYSILVMFLVLILGILGIFGSRKAILDKTKLDLMNQFDQDTGGPVFSVSETNITIANTGKVSGYSFDPKDGVKAFDASGTPIPEERITYQSTPTFNSATNGTYYVTYYASDKDGKEARISRTITVIDPIIYAYNYKGDFDTFTAPFNGVYQIELWGASGGNGAYNQDGTGDMVFGGNGAYVKGNISLYAGTNLYIYVGGSGKDGVSGTKVEGGYNGGGAGGDSYQGGASGGGATDIRLISGSFDHFESLKSRLMVASGGAGASNYQNAVSGGAGGGLTGEDGKLNIDSAAHLLASGGTQTSGGTLGGEGSGVGFAGGFGYGGAAQGSGSGGGGGYYGGGGSGYTTDGVSSGAGGSSFISGHTGCDAIAQESTVTALSHLGNPVHYSAMKFTNTVMKSGIDMMPNPKGEGTIVGNKGNGYVRIILLKRVNG